MFDPVQSALACARRQISEVELANPREIEVAVTLYDDALIVTGVLHPGEPQARDGPQVPADFDITGVYLTDDSGHRISMDYRWYSGLSLEALVLNALLKGGHHAE